MTGFLPKQVGVTPKESLPECAVHRDHWQYFVNTALDVGAELRVNPQLKTPSWSAFEFRVDGVLAAYDYSDFLPFGPASWKYKHWFKRAFCAGHEVYRHLASFAPASFLDWDQYRRLVATGQYTATGSAILHKQVIPKPTGPVSENLHRRRMKAREILVSAFGDRVNTAVDPQPVFFAKALDCLVSVHISGSWPHLLDRGQQQMFALGVSTISPDIWTYCLDGRPQAWVHDVPIRDDFSDLVQKVQWCDTHRDECRRIGRQARAFFVGRSTPQAAWTHAMKRLAQ